MIGAYSLVPVRLESLEDMGAPKQATLVSTIIFVVRYTGLWHTERKMSKHPLAMLAMFCFLGSYVFQTIALFLFKDDIEHLFEVFSVISFCGMGILKLFSLSHKSELWLSLLDQMKVLEEDQLKNYERLSAAEYESDSEADNNQAANLTTIYTRNFKRAAKILYKIYCLTGVVFILSPFIEFAFGLLNGNIQEGYPHILPSWNPFDSIHFLCYLVIVICETVAAIYCVCIHIAFDLTVIGVMIFVCGQFASLVSQSEKIGGRGKICSLSKRRDVRAHARIINCHLVHIQLVRFISELDSLLKNIIGFYFFLATLTLCTVAVRFKSEQMGAMQLLSLLQYMCATLTQLYIYCSFGDALYNESSISAGQGPFGAAIWCLSPKIRREVTMLGFGMMRPRRLHAGPFNTVDLPSFIQIVRAAYSYYAVLGSKSE